MDRAGLPGRPSSFSQDTADTICARIAGGESLRGICRDDDMPDAATVFRWLASADARYAGFREQYARAREIQAECLVDEILEISDDGSNDWMERTGKDKEPGWVLNGEHVQRSRLRVDSRKWFASKVAPKKYGERIEHVGEVTHNYVAAIPAQSNNMDEWQQQNEPRTVQ